VSIEQVDDGGGGLGVGQYGAQACAAEARIARFTARKRTNLKGAIALIDWWSKRAIYVVIAWSDLMAQFLG
jgi:hypothetical protein